MINTVISYRAVVLAIALAGAVGCGSQAEVSGGREAKVASLSRGCGSAAAPAVQEESRPRPPVAGMCR
jgi:hypothetical protein